MASFSDDEHFAVDSILEQRKRKGNLEYLVRWKGAGDGSDTWEPAKTIAADCAQAVQAFLSKTKAPKAKRSTSRSRKVSRSRSRSSSRSRRSRSANKTPNKSKSETRLRGRSQKKEEEKLDTSNDSNQKAVNAVASHSTSSVEIVTGSSRESTKSEQKTNPEEKMPTQRALRSSTLEARKELEVQRVHNDQRPVREDDCKPRSAIWRIADYAVIILFVLSLIAAFFLFLEKIFDLEEFKKQAYPNMGVLKRRLFSAQQRLVDLAEAGVHLAADSWLYLVEQIKGPVGKESEVPTQAPPRAG